MNAVKPARILIVGAGAMGLVVGYILAQGGASISYLVRPNRLADLSRPQLLYSYDDNSLRSFAGFEVRSDPEEIKRGEFDFIVLTLDGAALRSPEGQALVQALADKARGTDTVMLIGTIGIDLRQRLLDATGLAPDQVFSGGLFIVAYQTARVTLPVHPPTDPALLGQADIAFRQASPVGMFVDDSAPEAAQRFAALFGAAGTSQCVVLPAQAFSAQVPAVFPVFAACNIMGWPHCSELGSDPGLWDLTAAAVREIQGLSINGEFGLEAQSQTTAEGLIAVCRHLEESSLPLDHGAFNRFHHGGKVFEQDIELLRDCVAIGLAEGKPMSALKALIERTGVGPSTREG